MKLLAFPYFLLTACAWANWPQFRGPGGLGVASGDAPPAELTSSNILWSAELPGRGLGSPIVWGDKVFLSAASGPQQERLHIFCFSSKDGSRLWERQFQATGRTMCHEKTCVAAPTPCTDGERVYVLYSTNDVICLDFDGNVQWLRGLTHDYPNASNSLGMASSPVIVDGTLVAMIENDSDSFTVGLDAKSGENRWKMARTKTANWSSPVLFQQGSKTNVGLMSKDGVVAVDPTTGSQLWRLDGGGSTIPSCTVAGQMLYVPVKGLTAYDFSKTGIPPEEAWSSAQMNSATATPVAAEGFIYTVNGAGVLNKASATDGKAAWKLRLDGRFSASPVLAGNRLFIPTEDGVLKVVDITAEPEGKITSQLKLGETILGTPAIAGGSLYLRCDQHLWKIGK